MSRGVIYAAVGSKYVAEAINSARSSLRFNAVPHVIFCDQALADNTDGIEFRKIAPSGDPFRDKIEAINSLPFDETLFLDTDTYVTANLDELFDLLRRFDIALAHAPGYLHSGDPEPSAAFYDLNTGVIAYRLSDPSKAVLREWRNAYAAGRNGPLGPYNTHDQPALRSAIWNTPAASLYVLGPEYNCRPIWHVRLIGHAKIIHGRTDNYEEVARFLNNSYGPRLFAANNNR